jgi:hypothetical protein
MIQNLQSMVIALLVAVLVVKQLALVEIPTVTTSPFTNEFVVNLLLFVPTVLPLTNH